jgi:hypothetical protein
LFCPEKINKQEYYAAAHVHTTPMIFLSAFFCAGSFLLFANQNLQASVRITIDIKQACDKNIKVMKQLIQTAE